MFCIIPTSMNFCPFKTEEISGNSFCINLTEWFRHFESCSTWKVVSASKYQGALIKRSVLNMQEVLKHDDSRHLGPLNNLWSSLQMSGPRQHSKPLPSPPTSYLNAYRCIDQMNQHTTIIRNHQSLPNMYHGKTFHPWPPVINRCLYTSNLLTLDGCAAYCLHSGSLYLHSPPQ